MSHPSTDNLYVNPEAVEFLYVSQFPHNSDAYLDIDFADVEPRAQAVLTYDFEAKIWRSIIVTSEEADGEFSEEHETTAEQHATLLGLLPARLEAFRVAAANLYDETGSFDGVKDLDLAQLLEEKSAHSPK
jgi:hypothetical protein